MRNRLIQTTYYDGSKFTVGDVVLFEKNRYKITSISGISLKPIDVIYVQISPIQNEELKSLTVTIDKIQTLESFCYKKSLDGAPKVE